MLIMKLIHNANLNFINELQELREVLKKKEITIGLVESIEHEVSSTKIICDDDIYDEKIRNTVNLYVSNILYKIVLEEYRQNEMFDFLMDTYFFLKQDEILEVEEIIINILKIENKVGFNKSIFCMNKINSILLKIKECLDEYKIINIKGFITFRMKELRENIEEIIDKIIEEYMVEKEYKEFVKLLKYFVDIQESRIEEINIFIQEEGGYSLKNKNGEDIFNEFLKELSECKVDTEANIEDIIISGLITNAPKRIIIHKKENNTNKEFLNTIMSVFGDRATYCKGCSECTLIKSKI